MNIRKSQPMGKITMALMALEAERRNRETTSKLFPNTMSINGAIGCATLNTKFLKFLATVRTSC